MRVLLVSHFFPPKRTAGAEKITQSYAMGLLSLGHSVQVLCIDEWESQGEYWQGYRDEVYQGIQVRRVNLNWTAARDPNRYLYDNPEMETQVASWLEDWKPDVVHVVSLLTVSASVIRAFKRNHVPIVLTMTDFWLICPKINLVRGDQTLCNGITTSRDCLKCLMWNTKAYRGLMSVFNEQTTSNILKWVSSHPSISRRPGFRGMALNMDERKQVMGELAQLIDCIFAPSTYLGNVIDASGILPDPVPVIHYGHDLSWLKTMPGKTVSDVVRFGYIGQIIPIKGVHLLVAAFQAAVGNRKAQLLIYGDTENNPEYTQKLKSMIRPDYDIRFMGGFPHSKLGEVLSTIDISIVPSQWHENNPLVIQEAFASKTPVIGSNMGGISEFIQHNVNGLLFSYDQVDDLRDQINLVISDPTIINRLQKNIKPVKPIMDEIMEYIAIYQRLIQTNA